MSDSPPGGASSLVALVSALLAQLDGTAVTECEFRAGQQRVLVRRTLSFVPPVASADLQEEPAVPAHWQAITAPLTGVFYLTESPQSPPLVGLGSVVIPGQRVGLIESMKMFNAVESEITGTVRAILIANAAEVQTGQVLIYLEPLGDAA